eukprot:Clim_evm40s119 gene=Clim_evmTU40s119
MVREYEYRGRGRGRGRGGYRGPPHGEYYDDRDRRGPPRGRGGPPGGYYDDRGGRRYRGRGGSYQAPPGRGYDDDREYRPLPRGSMPGYGDRPPPGEDMRASASYAPPVDRRGSRGVPPDLRGMAPSEAREHREPASGTSNAAGGVPDVPPGQGLPPGDSGMIPGGGMAGSGPSAGGPLPPLNMPPGDGRPPMNGPPSHRASMGERPPGFGPPHRGPPPNFRGRRRSRPASNLRPVRDPRALEPFTSAKIEELERQIEAVQREGMTLRAGQDPMTHVMAGDAAWATRRALRDLDVATAKVEAHELEINALKSLASGS